MPTGKETLREDARLPALGGSLVAYFADVSLPRETHYRWEPRWRLTYRILGPDARYNAGSTYIEGSRFDDFLASAHRAVGRMQLLESEHFSGTWDEVIMPKVLSIRGTTGALRLHMIAESDTYAFSEAFDLGGATALLVALATLPERGARLAATLGRLSPLDA